jgi:4-alpha-glucanotransferase
MELARSSGILLHPTSLPGKYGIGSLGNEAIEFIDFLARSGQKIWQICPLGPTGYGDSPYQCFSAFAGNPLLIDLELLIIDGFLRADDIIEQEFSDETVDFGKVIEWKFPILKKAFHIFDKSRSGSNTKEFDEFCEVEKSWLDDYALFMTLKDTFRGKPWFEWDEQYKMREKSVMNEALEKYAEKIRYHKFLQYIFFVQWHRVKEYANSRSVFIVGDIPLYVAHDSSDAWSHSEIFQFDVYRNPIAIAGVPPDYFSATGQLWGKSTL